MTLDQLCSQLGIDYDEYLEAMSIDDHKYVSSDCAMLLSEED